MDYNGLSTNGLLMMHGGIRDALAVDDNTAAGEPRPCGVREYPDWRQHANALEAELDSRGVNYMKLFW